MNENLLNALAEQLKEQGSCIFKHQGNYYNVYYNEVDGYDYEVYESMDSSEPFEDTTSCEVEDEKEVILFAIL
jgi:hypothetical protein